MSIELYNPQEQTKILNSLTEDPEAQGRIPIRTDQTIKSQKIKKAAILMNF